MAGAACRNTRSFRQSERRTRQAAPRAGRSASGTARARLRRKRKCRTAPGGLARTLLQIPEPFHPCATNVQDSATIPMIGVQFIHAVSPTQPAPRILVEANFVERVRNDEGEFRFGLTWMNVQY